MATTKETVLARISIDDNTKVGFQSYARNAERAKKTTEAFRAHAVDKLVESLDKQVMAIGKSARELDILKAASLNAADGELALINKLHDDIDAHNQATEAAIRLNKERDQEAAAAQKIADAVNRTNNAYRDEAATVDMTSDELEIYRLKMMGASQAQLDSVMATQQATKEFRKQGSAAKGAHGQLRLMRGGLGQVGHQIQDVAVQLQMGQNALLIFGQQGSQIASLFGQNGALIGAVLAVGAALGTYFMPKIFSSKDALKELQKAAEDTSKVFDIDFANATIHLSSQFADLAKESRGLADATLRAKLVESLEASQLATENFADSLDSVMFDAAGAEASQAGKGLELLTKELGISGVQAERLTSLFVDFKDGTSESRHALANYVKSLTHSADGTKEYNSELVKINLKLQEYSNELNKAEKVQKALTDAIDGTVPATKKEKDALEKLNKEKSDQREKLEAIVEGYHQELIALEQGEEALMRYNLAQQGATEGQINLIMATKKSVDAIREANEKKQEEIDSADKAKASQDDFIASLRESTQEIGLNADALTRLQGQRLGVDPAVIESLIAERNARLANVAAIDAAAQAEIDTQAAIDEVEASRKDLVSGIIAESKALGKSAIDLAIDQAALIGLGETAQAQFDAAIQRIRDYEKAQEDLATKKTTEGKIEALRRSLLSEEEVLLESLHSQQQLIDNAEALAIINQQQAADMKLAIEADYHKKKNALLKEGTDQEILQGSKLTGHMLGQLGKQFSGVQANNRKMFAAQKAYKIAKATQNTFDAANEALASPYPWPLPQVFAATAVAAGLANVAAIKSSSFEGGGFTGTGGRSGGVDGKGGFPAILHPNETVIDHTKGQGGGITVVNNIDATGSGADVDMKIRAAMQQTSQQTIMSIQDLMRRRRFG
jgi:hypothetical protein